MKLKRIKTYNRYLEIVENYSAKDTVSNDYIQREAESLIMNGCLFESCSGSNAFLLVRKDTCYRVYYYLNDFSEIVNFDGEDLVVEILYRGEAFYPHKEEQYLQKCGFETNLVRDQYAGIYKDLQIDICIDEIKVKEAITLDEVKEARSLFNTSFDKFSGDYIANEECQTLFDNKNILIAKNSNGEFLGALHQTKEKRAAWISHVVVKPENRGKGIGKALMNTFIERNHVDDKSRYMLWVQQQNKPAVTMYQNAGFIYTGKSTLSMIKSK